MDGLIHTHLYIYIYIYIYLYIICIYTVKLTNNSQQSCNHLIFHSLIELSTEPEAQADMRPCETKARQDTKEE